MTILITGGSKCGKSRFAEEILANFTGEKFYIATMQPYGQDAQEAISRHWKMRSGKGFKTIEKYRDIAEIKLPERCGVLLECVGNLCANEMFTEGGMTFPSQKISGDILALSRQVERLVIVTNQVGSDGFDYPEGTADYIVEMGKINRNIAEFADCVVECVCGIPVFLKGGMPC